MNKRLLSIDLMRFLAIFLMFIDHALKLFYDFKSPDIFFEIAKHLVMFTTFSAPLFLFLVGFSVIISYKSKTDTKNWLRNKLKRSFFLIIMSFLLYFYTYGTFGLPYTSGVLQLIGISLIISSLLAVIIKVHKRAVYLLLAFLILTINFYLHSQKLYIPVISISNFPLVPYLTYVFFGSLTAEMFFRAKHKEKVLRYLFMISSFFVFFFIFLAGFNPFSIIATYLVINNFIIHSTLLTIFYSFLMMMVFASLVFVEEFLEKSKFIRELGFFGREALNIYILHILLGWGISKYLLDGKKFGFTVPLIFIAIFTILGWLWVNYRTKNKKQSKDIPLG